MIEQLCTQGGLNKTNFFASKSINVEQQILERNTWNDWKEILDHANIRSAFITVYMITENYIVAFHYRHTLFSVLLQEKLNICNGLVCPE